MHAQVAENWAKRLRQTEEGRALIATYRDMIEDLTGIEYTNAIGQPFGGWTDGQVALYARVHHLIATSAVHKLTVPVGAAPGRDSDRQGNQGKLSAGLPDEFKTEVYQGTSHDGDALLSWPRDAVMPWSDGTGNETEQPLCEWTDNAPLEIGHTDASRTWLHLLDSGIVARWPYGSTDIWLFFFADVDEWMDVRHPQGQDIFRDAVRRFR